MAAAFPLARSVSPEEFLLLDDPGLELVDGEMKERNVSVRSSQVGVKFVRVMGDYADAAQSGKVFAMDLGMQVFAGHPSWIRKADCSFVATERLPSHDEGYLRTPPNLVIEVVSPNDIAGEVVEKARLWLDAGVDVVWVAYPGANEVHVYRRGGSAIIVRGDEPLEGEGLLAGFSVAVSRFFAD